ncbi:MAG: beta-glucosidase [Candidatus Eisenbacteria bacterium]|nr:beta-glucosidase [Candidatus Eisenbacteria bacterium]
MAVHRFPDDFLWGVATSAQQIEGARSEGGRGDSVWDAFALQEGTIEDGSTPFVACDHYHRMREDVGIMAWLGVTSYRFSTSWSRVMPGGTEPNATGLDFYDALVDALLEHGIEPFITLNHWDMPVELLEPGGWSSRGTVPAFVEYARAVAARLGDRVRFWTTHNEPWVVATLGYEDGCHAPGWRDPGAALRAAHHLLLSHGLATEAVRREVADARVGIVLNLVPSFPHSDTDGDREAARWFDSFFNTWYLDPLFRGEYPQDGVRDRVRRGHLESGRLPFVEKGDMETIQTPIDLLGVNYYTRAVMKAGPDGGPERAEPAPGAEFTEMGWEVYPDGLTDLLIRVHEEYAPGPMYVTENGIALPEPDRAGERIEDPRRIAYLRDHLIAAHRAIEAGVPLRGYFHWSLMDNFEWGHGYTKRFGLYHVDFETCERTPKASAHWYRDTIAANAVDDDEETRSSTGDGTRRNP